MNHPVTQELANELTAGWSAVGVSRPHESAELHVLGQATYTDDIPELQGTLHAALGLSAKAHARIATLDLAPVRAMPGVVAVLTADDIPGTNDCGPIIHDDPILAQGEVLYVGQPMFIVIADTHTNARRAARKANVTYEELPAILTPQQAKAANSYVLPPMRLERGDAEAAFARAPHVARGELFVGGQEQFYLEGQIAYAIPKEGRAMLVQCSTQHPSEMQHVVAHALGLNSHHVTVECRRMGGGFGGKESQSALWAAAAAIAANYLKRPVKLRADRDDDMMVTGKRHCFWYEYEVGYDDTGRILAARVDMTLRAGFSADLSGPVATRAVCHFDNCYYLSDVDIRAGCGKTNTQSNTAFRGFGGPQGAIAIEYVIDEIARNLGKDALDVRRQNFYGIGERDETPYGQAVVDNVLPELTAQLEESSEYRARRAAIDRFNAASPVLKKGLAFTPVKFGIAFNVTHLNQAGALVHVYVDGSVLVNHGGTEMGQGVNTKVMQVVAHELGLDLRHVRIAATDTSKVANTSATAASTGADLNGKAAQDAARQIRDRLAAFAVTLHGGDVADVHFFGDAVHVNGVSVPFAELVQKAYLKRVQLWSDGFYATPGLSWDPKTMRGHPFQYYAYGAAVSEVVVDTLTGEWKLLRADALYDAGRSLNPAIDIGQVEGAFIQGMGWLTTEQLWWNDAGKLMTHAPSTYKIPAISDCPEDFRVRLFEKPNVADSIHRSKAVGEPPLLLPFSVFFAIRDAISSVGGHRVNPPLNAPATCEEILRAIDAVAAQSQSLQETNFQKSGSDPEFGKLSH
ncbi:xanthine dehydrogenase molybdenum binding subunit apoprotein [Pseudoduganella flava]|uniref:Xanthine dehydrogenase molybdenum binding subunit apoprotein n=1 Tax=Pseudoduganella flava TaxID=871742 RepID=A0A562Q3G5_9BURK|nr:xanthine dehydrogenase molybdopterin binding subunit [Pseudoduganella flava]QGZ41341.1 xanthine dehydrogenase molybdopterin binding subunit [Pseudoduganella flava]TWI51287.1 xanthine dehydrogenase molybdenum binding subunit apoprotein [Pseudoduganella flava]